MEDNHECAITCLLHIGDIAALILVSFRVPAMTRFSFTWSKDLFFCFGPESKYPDKGGVSSWCFSRHLPSGAHAPGFPCYFIFSVLLVCLGQSHRNCPTCDHRTHQLTMLRSLGSLEWDLLITSLFIKLSGFGNLVRIIA